MMMLFVEEIFLIGNLQRHEDNVRLGNHKNHAFITDKLLEGQIIVEIFLTEVSRTTRTTAGVLIHTNIVCIKSETFVITIAT